MKDRTTLSGRPAETPHGATPTLETRPDGQKTDHWVLSPEARAKGFVRPVRNAYQHVGIPGPIYSLRPLTEAEQQEHASRGYTHFESYPDAGAVTGRYWTAEQLAKVGGGCGTVTTMPPAIAETYAAQPRYYGSTFCCGCKDYLPVGRDGEFVWDGTNERVGT